MKTKVNNLTLKIENRERSWINLINLFVVALRKDTRQSVSDIADSISHSRSAVSEKIKRLKLAALYAAIKPYWGSCSEIIDIFKRIPEVQSCHGISGDIDLLVYLCAEPMDSLQHIREHIASQESIVKVKTHIVLSEWVNHLA
ncbi:Lrp/AsnC family transcriptional regulator [Dasania marina]|uniref:Lrp/AsnC family transcriptional regulator n=1 Tax=Dasania marina TaxID=471499 RepID=UPI0004B64F1E|nr:Lrp/AsnC ligand binding domain-containing protein [Dasania marina]